MVDGETLSAKGSTMGDKLHELAPGQTKRVDATPFILTPFDGALALCNLSFRLRTSFRESVAIGQYCYRDDAVAKGPCGVVL